MTTSAAALRDAVHAALSADSALVALLGGTKIYDEPPRGATMPYVTFGDTRVIDASTGDDEVEEHQLVLHCWSRQGGRQEAQMIAGALLQALNDATLTLAGFHLATLRFAFAEIRREPDGRTYRALVRFRAVTEPHA